MADPVQVGTLVVAQAAPTFANFIVVDGTWKETDPREVEELKNGNSETFNYTGANPGIDAECTWVVKDGEDRAAKMDVVVATYPGAVTKSFMVMEVTTDSFGGRALKQNVKLVNRASVTYGS